MPVDPALLWSMPLLATAAANDDDNDDRGIEIQTFPVMDATYTADVVVRPNKFFTTTTK